MKEQLERRDVRPPERGSTAPDSLTDRAKELFLSHDRLDMRRGLDVVIAINHIEKGSSTELLSLECSLLRQAFAEVCLPLSAVSGKLWLRLSLAFKETAKAGGKLASEERAFTVVEDEFVEISVDGEASWTDFRANVYRMIGSICERRREAGHACSLLSGRVEFRAAGLQRFQASVHVVSGVARF
ncbi:hypothetical protein H6M51_14835 [Rhizobium sp. AQ_MP]|uniref:hypothetical protein n=1 Tax=Rhizobium sp. AQ_MP TaxID=2761536 RepID=UPI0016397321|nr:hypothetical protein [Rhizobium sp. AQ_MP]MBC2774137.1 hypothetical protein [Rhizobium sp. AQ_MP]